MKKLIQNQDGFGLLQGMIGLLMVAIMSMAVMSIGSSSDKMRMQMVTDADRMALMNQVYTQMSTLASCGQTLAPAAGQTAIPAVVGTQVSFRDLASVGQMLVNQGRALGNETLSDAQISSVTPLGVGTAMVNFRVTETKRPGSYYGSPTRTMNFPVTAFMNGANEITGCQGSAAAAQNPANPQPFDPNSPDIQAAIKCAGAGGAFSTVVGAGGVTDYNCTFPKPTGQPVVTKIEPTTSVATLAAVADAIKPESEAAATIDKPNAICKVLGGSMVTVGSVKQCQGLSEEKIPVYSIAAAQPLSLSGSAGSTGVPAATTTVAGGGTTSGGKPEEATLGEGSLGGGFTVVGEGFSLGGSAAK
ncbi:MAG: type II secretion system protein J [Bacteriovoracia bacterium]